MAWRGTTPTAARPSNEIVRVRISFVPGALRAPELMPSVVTTSALAIRTNAATTRGLISIHPLYG
jgi:hypothetical protein